MRRTLFWLRLAILTLVSGCAGYLARAQSTIPVTGTVGDASNGIPPGLAVKFELYNCGANLPRVVGVFGIIKQDFTLTPDLSGHLAGTIWPNDVIDCGGVTGTTRYNVTVLLNNIPQTLTACYAVLSTMGTFNLNTATPCTGSSPPTPPGPPYDGAFLNLTVAGLLTGGNAVFSGTVEAHQFLLDFTPAGCGAGNYMTGYTASFGAICGSPAGASILSFNGRGGNVVPVTGDYSCAMVPGSVCGLPAFYYQTVEAGGAVQTQRGRLNLIAGANAAVSCADNAGNNSTDCTVSVTAASDSATVCGASGCYYVKPDGTKQEWGTVTAPTSSGTLVNVAITFPLAFTGAPALVVSGGSDPDGTDDAYVVYHKGLSTAGATAVVRCANNVGGSGCPALSTAVPVHWQAIGR